MQTSLVIAQISNNWAEIIGAAAQSELGVFSLLILICGLIALYFFRNSEVWIRLLVFILIFLGVVGYGFAISQKTDGVEGDRPSTEQPQLLSNPKIVVYPQRDEEAVTSALASLRYEIGLSDKDKARSTNSVWFGREVAIEDVKQVATSLVRNNIPIQSIRRFNHTRKPKTIEIGTDRNIPSTQPVWTVQQISNASQFDR